MPFASDRSHPFVLATANGRLRLAPLALAVAGALGCAGTAEARITRITVTTHESPTFGGYSWPGVGQYEKIAGKAFGEVNPTTRRTPSSSTSRVRRATPTATASTRSTSTS